MKVKRAVNRGNNDMSSVSNRNGIAVTNIAKHTRQRSRLRRVVSRSRAEDALGYGVGLGNQAGPGKGEAVVVHIRPGNRNPKVLARVAERVQTLLLIREKGSVSKRQVMLRGKSSLSRARKSEPIFVRRHYFGKSQISISRCQLRGSDVSCYEQALKPQKYREPGHLLLLSRFQTKRPIEILKEKKLTKRPVEILKEKNFMKLGSLILFKYVISTVTIQRYVYTDFEPWRFQWVSNDGIKVPDVAPQSSGQAPPSPHYVSGPEHPPSPNYVIGPEEPEQAPLSLDYLPKPEYPQTLPPGYVADFGPGEDLKEDPADYLADRGDDDDEESSDDDDNDDGEEEQEASEDDDKEEEHLAC
ncbi:hypothetical protein Tco_0407176 [Tanacetum coccineum]